MAELCEQMRAYERQMEPFRLKFANTHALSVIMKPDVPKELLELFLMHFTSIGVGMTELVDKWMTRAGERCRELGLAEFGESMIQAAATEEGHHLMMVADTHKLVAHWNSRHSPKLDAASLLRRPMTPGVAAYHKLHDDTISGPTPYGQLAIEHEIEMLSGNSGEALIKHCAALLGKEFIANLSFIEQHVLLDAGHTKVKTLEMNRILGAQPTFEEALFRAGSGALEAYGQFLNDCLMHAEAIYRSGIRPGA
jgi:hypothetical protein